MQNFIKPNKPIFLVLLLAGFYLASISQTSISTLQFNNFNVGRSIPDGNGNYIISGGAPATGITLTGCGSSFTISRSFIGKYDPVNVCWGWVYQFPNNYPKSAASLKDYDVDGSGNVFITGSFYGTVNFTGSISKTSAGSDDIFTMKIGSSGTVSWVATDGTANEDFVNGIKVDGSGSAIISGEYNRIQTNMTTGAGKSNIFIAKYNSSGTRLWMNTYQGAGYYNGRPFVVSTGGNSIAVDESGNIYQTGYVCGNVTITNKTISITSGSNSDQGGFLIKYSSSGVPQWAKSYYAKSSSKWYSNIIGTTNCIGLDGSGNVYLSGYWHDGTINFGNGVSLAQADTILENIRANFILKVNNNGTSQWARKILYNLGNMTGLIVSSNNIFSSGQTWQNSSVDIQGAGTLFYPTGLNNSIIAEFNASGNFVNAFLPVLSGTRSDSASYPGSVNVNGISRISGGFMIFGSVSGHVSNSVTYSSTLALDNSNSITASGSNVGFMASYINALFKTNGINNTGEIKLVSVYPNPVSDILNIKTLAENNVIMLSDIRGNIIYKNTLTSKTGQVDVNELSPGIYFLRVEGEPGAIKILKQ